MVRTPSILLIIALVAPACGGAQAKPQQIPFVGCPADGQVGPSAPPQGAPKSVSIDGIPADEIAYYKAEQAPGVYAPRGWYCRAWYGSSGGFLMVMPSPIDPPGISSKEYFPPPRIQGSVVLSSRMDGGTSGAWEVAPYAVRLFPVIADKFIQNMKTSTDKPSILDRLRNTKDSVKIFSPVMAEFITPANSFGLGADDDEIVPSQEPISGIAFLENVDPAWPNLRLVRLRLGSSKNRLEAALLDLNRKCIQTSEGC